MAKKTQKSFIESIALLMVALAEIIVNIIIRLIIGVFDLITYYSSGYKEKSGIGVIKTLFDKGTYGEFNLYKKVIKLIGKDSVLTNVYLENQNTDFTEIDVLAVTNKGIYVFEMKNYGGYIYGSEKDKTWTQVMHKFSKHKFYNPIRQNYAHQKAVEKRLNLKSMHMIPIVVFSNRSKLSKINVGPNTHVYQYKDALRFMKNNEFNGKEVFTNEEKQLFLVTLIQSCRMSDALKANHIAQVKALTLETS